MEVFCGKCKYYKYKSSGYGSDHYHCRKQVTEEITNSFTRKHTAVHYGDARDINEKNDCPDFEFSSWRFIQKRRHLADMELQRQKEAEAVVQNMNQNEEEFLEMDDE